MIDFYTLHFQWKIAVDRKNNIDQTLILVNKDERIFVAKQKDDTEKQSPYTPNLHNNIEIRIVS